MLAKHEGKKERPRDVSLLGSLENEVSLPSKKIPAILPPKPDRKPCLKLPQTSQKESAQTWFARLFSRGVAPRPVSVSGFIRVSDTLKAIADPSCFHLHQILSTR